MANLRVVSDLHLNPEAKNRNSKFLSFLEDAFKKGDRVLIVGDLFDLWFGWSKLFFKFQHAIINGMNDLASSGLKLYYVEGNRDFGISELEGKLFEKVAANALCFQWGSRTIYAEHGDLINKADRQYRTFRKISKNRFTYFMLRNLPSSWMLALTTRLEESLKNTNMQYRIGYPEEQCKLFRDEIFQSGADIIIAGHFHQEKQLKEQLNSRTVMFYNLPGWESGFRYLVIPQTSDDPYFVDFKELS
jgi:UDP-2,3-diacylglucosamine hydrolase